MTRQQPSKVATTVKFLYHSVHTFPSSPSLPVPFPAQQVAQVSSKVAGQVVLESVRAGVDLGGRWLDHLGLSAVLGGRLVTAPHVESSVPYTHTRVVCYHSFVIYANDAYLLIYLTDT